MGTCFALVLVHAGINVVPQSLAEVHKMIIGVNCSGNMSEGACRPTAVAECGGDLPWIGRTTNTWGPEKGKTKYYRATNIDVYLQVMFTYNSKMLEKLSNKNGGWSAK